MDKKEIRQQIQRILKGIPFEQYKSDSYAIAMKVLLAPSIIEGKTIAVTISNYPEVDTIALIEALWSLGKRVAVPKCNPKTKEMDFYIIEGFYELETVYMHLREPIPAVTEYVDPASIDVMIVPGVVFDENGYRVGYGGGFYDRYLVHFNGELVSMVFDEQLQYHVPTKDHDIPVNNIFTQTRIINCRRNREES